MRTASIRLIAVFLCVFPQCGMPMEPVDSASVQERLDHVERVIGSRALTNLLGRVDDLQREIRVLRGQVEIQAHELSQIEKSQRSYYLDLDKRLQRVEATAGSRMTIPQTSNALGAKNPSSVVSNPSGAEKKSLIDSGKSIINHRSVDNEFARSQSEDVVLSSASDQGQEDTAYQKAFDLLKKKRYSEAVTWLKAFLDQYPRSQYVENAQYWLGEAYYVLRHFKLALSMFQKFLLGYPSSSKTNDVLLKIGYVQDELGQKTEAEQTLRNLIEQHPDSTQAHLARKRLQKISIKTP
uniref:Cell division coordinator CpoB n=1 Tax=Candidatus Kentrum sp. SD TaxID=2126332 RepID=A0A451BKK9_9GAMM|nr:MAG: tol-pal system protein YbgF [Candidatus Kentron sp. SD]